jgi:signal peptidase II
MEQPVMEQASPAADIASWRSSASWARLLGVFAGGIALDLWSKSWAFANVAAAPVELTRERVLDDPSFALPHHPRVPVIPFDLLDFTLVLNYGAVFGIGQHRRELFIGFTVLATAAAVILFARGTRARMRMAHIAIGLILAGGLGNLYDRMTYGAVRDFLHMLPGWQLPYGWRWPGNATSDVFPWVFNVADVLLLAGMALFVIASVVEDRRARQLKTTA